MTEFTGNEKMYSKQLNPVPGLTAGLTAFASVVKPHKSTPILDQLQNEQFRLHEVNMAYIHNTMLRVYCQ
jgi:hypothetical protein